MKLSGVVLVAVGLCACTRTKIEEGPGPAGSASAGPGVEVVDARCTTLTGIKGNGQLTKTKRDAKAFVDVATNGSPDVEIKEGPFEVEVETDSNVQDSIETKASGTTLTIGGKGSYCTNRLKITVTMPLFHGATLDGSGTVVVSKTTPASDVALSMNGSGKITFRGDVGALNAGINGSGTIQLAQGSAKSTKATVNGSGNVKKTVFEPGTVTKQVNGSGTVAL